MACSIRRKGHPSFPSATTCCFFSSLKTLLMPREPINAPVGVNVPGFTMAGFQLTLYGRIWVTPEANELIEQQLQDLDNVDAEEEQRQEERRTHEVIVQQDLNQGMDTGTHSSVHRGVNWGPNFRVRSPKNKLRRYGTGL